MIIRQMLHHNDVENFKQINTDSDAEQCKKISVFEES